MWRTTRSASLALVAAGLLLAASCGGGDGGGDDVASVSGDEGEAAQSDETSEEEQERELLDWVECMNEDGVEIPDPVRDENGDLVIEGNGINIGGGGVRVGGGSQEDPAAEGEEPPFSREDMEAATEVCGPPPMVGAGDMSEEEQQERQDDALAFSECMRAEGIEDFPDPDFSDSGPGGAPQERSSEGSEGDGEGPDQQIVVGPFGEIDMDDPEAAAAFEACQDLLGVPGGGPGGDGGTEPAEDSEG
jgi:hypothetical protein